MKTAPISTAFFFGCLLLISPATLHAAESSGKPTITLHVAPEGNDAWSGSLPEPNPGADDGPLATIPRAQEIVRKLRTQDGLAKPIVVHIRGVHRLTEPIVITPEDPARPSAPSPTRPTRAKSRPLRRTGDHRLAERGGPRYGPSSFPR